MLVISTVITVLQPWDATLPGTLVVAAAATAWVLALDTFRPLWMVDTRRWLPAVYFLGMLAFAAVLILRAPWYGIYGFSCYVKAFEYLVGRWRFAGVAVTAILVATSQIGGLAGLRTAGTLAFAVLKPWRSWPTRTASSRRRWRRTPGCTPNFSPRHGRPACWTSGSGWPGRSTTRWRRG